MPSSRPLYLCAVASPEFDARGAARNWQSNFLLDILLDNQPHKVEYSEFMQLWSDLKNSWKTGSGGSHTPVPHSWRRQCLRGFRAKLHYTDTGYTDTANGQAHDNSTTNLPLRNARAQHLDMSRCWDVANFCPLVVFVGGVRSRCPCSQCLKWKKEVPGRPNPSSPPCPSPFPPLLHCRIQTPQLGGGATLPSPTPFHSPLPFLSLSSFPLEVGPLNTARESGGAL